MVRILGIDPGIATTGFGLIEAAGNQFRAITCGAILTPPDLCLAERLLLLHDKLLTLIEEHSPQQAAVEILFFARNSKTALTVGQARGVILLALAQAGLQPGEYTPLEVKKAVTGSGRAPKDQVQTMIRRILGIREPIRPPDAADALAIALCHAQTAPVLRG